MTDRPTKPVGLTVHGVPEVALDLCEDCHRKVLRYLLATDDAL